MESFSLHTCFLSIIGSSISAPTGSKNTGNHFKTYDQIKDRSRAGNHSNSYRIEISRIGPFIITTGTKLRESFEAVSNQNLRPIVALLIIIKDISSKLWKIININPNVVFIDDFRE